MIVLQKIGWCSAFALMAWLRLSGPALGAPLEADLERLSPRSEKVQSTGRYLLPNELTPGDARALYDAAPPGVHVSVGTERSFIGLALNRTATFGLFLDVNEQAALYNRINIILLAIAKDREEYLQLRFETEPDQWLTRAKEHGFSGASLAVLSDPIARRAWRKVNYDLEDNSLAADPKEGLGLQGRTDMAPVIPFIDANYLYYNEQFQRLSAMAKAGKIKAFAVDMADTVVMARIVSILAENKADISVLDVSNAWEEGYLGRAKILHIKQQLADKGLIGGSLILTRLRDKGSIRMWQYVGLDLSGTDMEFAQRLAEITVGCEALVGQAALR